MINGDREPEHRRAVPRTLLLELVDEREKVAALLAEVETRAGDELDAGAAVLLRAARERPEGMST